MAALFAQLPVVPFVAFPRILGETAVVDFRQSLPTGSFLRSFYPEPPFDELFPPRTEVVRVDAGLTTLTDDFFLTNASLDPPRVLDVERDAGLLGWRIWLQDSTTGRRISTVRTLEGTSASVRLDTTNESRTGAGDTLGAVLAPPESSIALPRYVSLAFSGSFGTLAYPPLPSPARVVGEVAEETSEGLLGYAARITFESTEIATLTGQARELLRYSTSVNTDDTGRFSTVLPPGRYTATVAPAEGTGYAVHRQLVTVDRDPTAVTLQPSRLTRIAGRALLVDGRPLAEAEVLATPQTPESDIPRPRSGRTTLGPDGSFEMNLDPGPYAITVIPKRGSGFPRVVIRSVIPAGARPGTPADVATLPDIRIPAPSPLSFRLADPRTEQAVRNALVRVYAVPGAVFGDELEDELPDPEPVEIGIASSNADGQVEILLAPAPR